METAKSKATKPVMTEYRVYTGQVTLAKREEKIARQIKKLEEEEKKEKKKSAEALREIRARIKKLQGQKSETAKQFLGSSDLNSNLPVTPEPAQTEAVNQPTKPEKRTNFWDWLNQEI